MKTFKIIFLSLTIYNSALSYFHKDNIRARSCRDLRCRPGRECKQIIGDKNNQISDKTLFSCQCRDNCPDHWKPVCGSDGVSYDNHCFLHKAACDSNKHISPVHSGFCSGDREAVIARQEFIKQLSLWDSDEDDESQEEPKQVPLPDACFENDRNRLREFLISWSSLSAKKRSWYTPGMTHGEELWGHFYQADKNRDLGLDSREWLEYLYTNNTQHKSDKMRIVTKSSLTLVIPSVASFNKKGLMSDKQTNSKSLVFELTDMRFCCFRQLCITELIHEGDNDDDGKLDFDEFREIMDDDYIPSNKVCDFDGIKFVDGAERTLECNGCVCACGKWICTSEICTEGYRDIENMLDDDSEEDSDEEDDYDEDPEDDPDVQDINWF